MRTPRGDIWIGWPRVRVALLHVRLVDAIATGRATEAVFAELEKAEGQKKVLQQRLARLDDANRFANQDTAGLKQDLVRRVTNMKELLGKHVPQTRQLLRKLIEERIVYTLSQDHRGRGYALAATRTYAALLGDLGMVNHGGGGEGS